MFLPLFSFWPIKLALIPVLPEAAVLPLLLRICLFELCAEEAFIGYKQGCWDCPVTRELLHYKAIHFTCSKVLDL